jgi:hypothetical protein
LLFLLIIVIVLLRNLHLHSAAWVNSFKVIAVPVAYIAQSCVPILRMATTEE